MRLRLPIHGIAGATSVLLLAACGKGATPVAETNTEIASAETLAAAAISAGQVPARGPFTFICGDNPADLLTARYYNTTPAAMLAERGGTTVLLFETRSASGAHYLSGTTSFWEHQGEVSLDWGNPPQQVICKAPQ